MLKCEEQQGFKGLLERTSGTVPVFNFCFVDSLQVSTGVPIQLPVRICFFFVSRRYEAYEFDSYLCKLNKYNQLIARKQPRYRTNSPPF